MFSVVCLLGGTAGKTDSAAGAERKKKRGSADREKMFLPSRLCSDSVENPDVSNRKAGENIFIRQTKQKHEPEAYCRLKTEAMGL